MNNFKKLLLVAAAGLMVTSARESMGSDLYPGNELSLDAFGYTATRDKGGGDHEAWGAGAGANYFFNQYLGLGADTYADAFTLPYLLNGSVIGRYPINGTPFAVYGFGGFGREWWHAPQWMGHVGVGGEYRFGQSMAFGHNMAFLRNTGAFVDIRGVFPGETTDYAVFRFGFRITFK